MAWLAVWEKTLCDQIRFAALDLSGPYIRISALMVPGVIPVADPFQLVKVHDPQGDRRCSTEFRRIAVRRMFPVHQPCFQKASQRGAAAWDAVGPNCWLACRLLGQPVGVHVSGSRSGPVRGRFRLDGSAWLSGRSCRGTDHCGRPRPRCRGSHQRTDPSGPDRSWSASGHRCGRRSPCTRRRGS